MENNCRYIAKFIVEATTPLAVGSGERGLTVDRMITRDVNGLPYLPGTSIAGVIRHAILDNLEEDEKEPYLDVFGSHEKEIDSGSRLLFSAGHLLAENGNEALEGICDLNTDTGYYSYFSKLPERDHVRMTDRGVADAKGHGKFDEELVHKGTRFVFDIELIGNEKDEAIWNEVIGILHAPFFRIGAGTRNGFGAFKIVTCKTHVFDLNREDVLGNYLNISGSLNYETSTWNEFEVSENNENWIHYQLELTPRDFFSFGAGFGDKDVDDKYKTERFIDWSSGSPELSEDFVLIPATSVKGAISHRVAYHYNLQTEQYLGRIENVSDEIQLEFDADNALKNYFKGTASADSIERLEEQIQILKNKTEDNFFDNSNEWSNFKDQKEIAEGNLQSFLPVMENNDAVREIFGFASDGENGQRGKVILTDVYLKKNEVEKIFNHVAIDRYTGGGIDGALFQEKVTGSDVFKLDFYIEKSVKENTKFMDAFESALLDLKSGDLALGGSTTKGHGTFVGNLKIVENITNE